MSKAQTIPKMKRQYALMIGLLFFMVISAHAQRGNGQRGQRMDPKEQAKNTAETWQEEFGLSDEQYTKTYDVLLASIEKRREKLQSLRTGGGFDREAMRTAIEELTAEQDKELKKIFSSTQWTAYEKWKEKTAEARRGRGRGGEK